MKAYVVDSSVVAKWFFEEEYAEKAQRLTDSSVKLYAPDFFLLELENVFCKRIRRGEMNVKDGNYARKMLKELPIKYYPFRSLQDKAFNIAVQTGRGLYDCLYLALALALKKRMVTADRKLYKSLAAGPFSDHILWVEDLS